MRFLSRFCSILLLLLPYALVAQCGLTVNAGPDAFFCPGGGSVQLNGSISGPGLSGFSWSPTTGLSDPDILNPIATVSSGITYTLTAEVFDPTSNSIINGDFSAGDSDFTTDYVTGTGGAFGLLSDEGQYVISTNSNLTHTNFGNCPDHTGGGNMMVVNGSDTPNDNVWCQTVPVSTNTTYAFNAWLQSVNPSNPAQLQFSVNGALLGNIFQASSSNCDWREFTESWNSGGATSAQICIVNQNTQPSGNDFAIDDIFFGEVCTQTDDVTLTEVFLDADAVPTADLLCDGFGGVSAILDGTNSSGGPNTFYQWTTADGNIVSGATTTTPTVNEPGSYVLTVRYDDGITFCTDDVTVVVNPNSGNIPTANAVILAPISCFDNTGILGIGTSSTGNDFIYDWSTTDGNIVSGATEEELYVDQTGTYQLLVTNTISGCTEMATVMIVDSRQDPTISIDDPAPLTCDDPMLDLDASGSDGGSDFTASWVTVDGNIISGENTLSPTIDSAGTYELTVVNETTGCSAVRTVMVTANQPVLTAAIATPDTLDCNLLQLRLDGSGSSTTPGSTFAWSTSDGNIVSDAATANPLIDAPGEYELQVRDPASGCEDTALVTVRSAAVQPSIALQNPLPFTCARAQIMLDATASTDGIDIAYTWTAANGGGIVSDTNTLQPTVMGPGDYTLRIVNNDNGCSRDTTITIAENITPPIANAGMGFTISCSTLTDTLDGTGSSLGANFSYEWSTTNGQLVQWTDSLQPIIGRAGTYQLRVLDSINGCSSVAEVTVLEDNNAPTVAITAPDTLTCRNPTLMLNAVGSDSGVDLTIDWTTGDGNFVMGTNSLSPTIDAPGTYLLTITDEINGCPSSRSVTVVENMVPPLTEAGDSLTLTCRDREGRLMATDLGSGYSYAWTGSVTAPIADANTPTPLVNNDGRYYLEITNDNNGCTAIDSVDVNADQDTPDLIIAPGLSVLTCADTSLQINPGSIAEPGFSYYWTSTDGNISSPDSLPGITVNEPGRYNILLTNESNGCANGTTLAITQDTISPNVNILPPATLNCDVTETTLNPGNSDVGGPFTVQWATTDGSILPGADENGATVEQGGTYHLTITNSMTGCVDSTEVIVAQDTVQPLASIADPIELTCTNRTQDLDGMASSQGPEFAYEWSTINGNISGNNNQLTVTANAAGRYLLMVRNTINFCVRADSVEVVANQPDPQVDAGVGGRLTCLDSTIILGGAAGAMDGLNYAWTTISGGTPAASDVPQTTTDQQGIYELRVTNDSTGCFALDTVTVQLDRATPNATVSAVSPLNCEVLQQTLVIGIQQPNLTYLATWSTSNGNIVGPTDGSEISLDQGGDYSLLMVNPENGCRDSTVLTVAQDTVRPLAAIAAPLELTCLNPVQDLDGSASSQGAVYSYVWSTMDGNLTGRMDQLTAGIDAAGRYQLIVRNTVNSCEQTDVVEVVENQASPVANAGTESLLTCVDTIAILGGTAGAMNGLSYAWTALSGGNPAATNVPQTTTDVDGTYELRVTIDSTGCFALDTVTVQQDRATPDATVLAVSPLNCEVLQQTLVIGIQQPNLTYLAAWSTPNGNIVGPTDGSEISIDQGGDYRLLMVNPENGCRDSTELTVAQDTVRPLAAIAAPLELTCSNPVQALDGSASSQGTIFSYAWSTMDGNLTGTIDQLTTGIDAAGRYQLIVRNTVNACEHTDVVEVVENQASPVANAGTESLLTCVDTIAILGGTAGAMNGLSYTWTTLSGGDPAATNAPQTTTVVQGTYELRVTIDSTGCFALDTVTVQADQALPFPSVPAVRPLNCGVLQRTLTAAPPAPGLTYLPTWSTITGNIVGPTDEVSIVVDQGGTYRLSLLNPANGCVDSIDVSVAQDTLAPRANIGIPRDLTCRNMTVSLDGRFSSSGPNIRYRWTTLNGTISGGATSPSPSVTAAGTYLLTVLNETNNCTDEAFIDVQQFDQPPVLSAATPATLTCLQTSVEISANRSGQGQDFSFTWTTADGNIVSGSDRLRPVVDQPGTYELTVVNTSTACQATLPVIVIQDIIPPTVVLGEDFDLGCEDVPVNLVAIASGPAPFSYNWATNDGVLHSGTAGSTPLIQGPGTYVVTVTSQRNGCMTSADITTTQALLLGFDFEQRNPTCRLPLGRVELAGIQGGTSPFLFAVDGQPFMATSFADSLAPGRYPLVVQDANGCEVNSEVTIPGPPELDLFVDPRAVITLGESYFINTRTNFADSSLTTISWTPALPLDCADCLRPTATPTVSTTFTVSILSSDGCAATDSIEIVVDVLRDIYFPTAFSPTGDGINDFFLPFGNTDRISIVQDFNIYDRWGESVFKNTDFLPNDPANGWDGRLNGRPMNPAVFVYTATVLFVDGRVVVFKGDVVLTR